MSPTTIWDKNVYFGKRKTDNKNIWLSKPEWNCDWYWGFGYLENQHEHYHLDGYEQPPNEWGVKRNINMHDALKEDYVLAPKIHKNLWLFCELSLTIYSFRTIAEVYCRGGSNYTTSKDIKPIVQNLSEWKRINTVILPQLFDKLYTIISPETK